MALVFGLLNEKKNEEGKQGKYLVKEDIRSAREMKHREGKGGNIWKGKISYDWRRKKGRKYWKKETSYLWREFAN